MNSKTKNRVTMIVAPVLLGLALAIGAHAPAYADLGATPVSSDSFTRTADCGTQTATVTDTQYQQDPTYVDGAFVLGAKYVVATTVFEVPLSEAEQIACQTPAPFVPVATVPRAPAAHAAIVVAPVIIVPIIPDGSAVLVAYEVTQGIIQ